jgi:hypothetical protein
MGYHLLQRSDKTPSVLSCRSPTAAFRACVAQFRTERPPGSVECLKYKDYKLRYQDTFDQFNRIKNPFASQLRRDQPVRNRDRGDELGAFSPERQEYMPLQGKMRKLWTRRPISARNNNCEKVPSLPRARSSKKTWTLC